MLLYIVLTLIWTLSWNLSSAFPMPDAGNVVACFSIDCLQQTVKNVKALYAEDEVLFVGIASVHFGSDSYLSLYIGYLIDLFDKMPIFKNVYFILLQLDDGIVVASANLFSILPVQSVFVCFEHGSSSFSISNVRQLKNMTGIGPTVIFHLNHEQPWDYKDATSMDYTFSSLDELISSYSTHPLVIRNYFYKPLLGSSHYFPVGPTLYGYMIANRSSTLYNAHMKPSSKRGTFCYFKGRTDYSFKRRGHIIPISADKPHVRDRLELIKLSNENKLGGCTASAYNPGLEHVGTTKQGVEHYDLYEKHVTSLADTVFSPCPAGNNPETFRHYESLELGAIPIVVRQKDNNDTDFLQYGAWKDYPGPVLDHWGQLKEYMSTANVEDVDALQQRVLDWYTAFKIDHKRILTEKLAKVFGKVRQEMERGAYKGRYSLTNRYVAAESVVNDAQVRAKLSKSLQKHTFTGDNRDEIVVNVEGNAKDRDNAILKSVPFTGDNRDEIVVNVKENAKDRDNAILKSVLIKLISYEARLVKVEAELEAAKLREGVLLKVVEEHTKECSSQCKDMGIM